MNLDEIHRLMGGSYDPECKYCGSDEGMVRDHIIPKALGGTNDPENLQEICYRCNGAKAATTEQDFLEWLDNLVEFRTKKGITCR